MSAVQLFDFRGEQLRCRLDGGEPQFVAADVARVLGYTSTQGMTRPLEEDEKGQSDWLTLGGMQRLATVNESGLYSAVFRSGLPMAKDFKRWVTKEVLPQIRQTGSYSRTDSPSAPAPANALASSAEIVALATHVLEQSAQLAVAAPKVEAFDELMDATGLFTMEQVAKSLGYGRNILFRELRKLGVLQGNNLPYQSHMRHFDIKVGVRQSHDGLIIPTSTTLVRPSGVEYIRKRLARAQADVAAGLPSLPGTQPSLSP